MLRVNQRAERPFLDSFLPFLYHCLATMSSTVVSSPELQAALMDDFGMNLPRGVITKLLHRAMSEGKVCLENDVYVIERAALDECNLTSARDAVQRGYRQLLDRAAAFALESGLNWNVERVDELFSSYLDGFSSSVLASAISGRPLPKIEDELPQDELVLHRFVARIHERNQQDFDFLVKIVKGRMLADSLYLDTAPKSSRAHRLDGLEVFLDGPILLYLLGYGGPELKAPYRELVEMLKRQGALIRCFRHNVMEAQEILDAAACRVATGKHSMQFPGDVVGHLMQSGNTRGEIEQMSDRMEHNLLKAGVQTVDTPERSAALQPDEIRLDDRLQRDIGYTSRRAKLRDIDSLTAVHRLRRGREFRDLASCQAVFVTRNYKLFSSSAQFFRPAGRAGRLVPLCAHHTPFITLVWLREPAAQPELPESRIIADAFAALNCSDETWRACTEEMARMEAREELADDEVRYIRYADEARSSLLDATLGDADAFTDGTVREVRARARDVLGAEIAIQLREARRALERTHASLRFASARIGRWSANAMFALLTICLLLGAALGPIGPIKQHLIPAPLQLFCAACAFTAGIFSVFANRPLLAVRDGLDRWLSEHLLRLLQRMLQLQDTEQPNHDPD